MEITTLGTSSMVPTINRNHSATLLTYKNENILIDCGEGTQRQFRKAKISPVKITKILITHWHGDHVLGLPGLMLTLGHSNYNKTLEIYGPKGTKKFMSHIYKFFETRLKIDYKVHEIEKGIFFENDKFKLEATELDHGPICLAYSFIEKNKRKIDKKYLEKNKIKANPILKQLQEGKNITYNGKKILASKATFIVPGKKITFIADTGVCKNAIEIAKKSDILFCESTFLSELQEKAKETNHLTVKDAANIAKKAKVKKLILTHFSQRYKDLKVFKKEAQLNFKNTDIAEDLKKFKI
ncbi:MAG: ribonuclease Z [Nanoarchaeota archaeon]|nr:ribonuclease Z [Nanoarchaeota archaeon]